MAAQATRARTTVTAKARTAWARRCFKTASVPEAALVCAMACAGLTGGCLVDASLGSWSAPGPASETAATSTSGSPHDESGSETGDGGDGDGDGDGDGVCTIEASDTPCETCLKHLCCAQLEACGGVGDCFCMLECLMSSDPVTCAAQCQPGLIYIQLVQCQAISCAAVCV